MLGQEIPIESAVLCSNESCARYGLGGVVVQVYSMQQSALMVKFQTRAHLNEIEG